MEQTTQELNPFLSLQVERKLKAKKKPYIKPAAVKRLEERLHEARLKRYAHLDIPPSYIVKVKRRDDTANGLTQCVIDWIRLSGGQAERINTTGKPLFQRDQRGQVRGVKWITGNTTRGSADISATIQGRSVKVEVKIGKDRQSEAQKAYQEAIEAAGGVYFIARSFTQFLEWYEREFPA